MGGDEAVWDEIAHPDVVVYGVTLVRGAAQAKAFYQGMRQTVPDWAVTIDDCFGEDDRVALRVTESGTMRGSFLGHTPTGKAFTLTALQILRFQDGTVREMWGGRDSAALLRQIGVGAPPAPPLGRE